MKLVATAILLFVLQVASSSDCIDEECLNPDLAYDDDDYYYYDEVSYSSDASCGLYLAKSSIPNSGLGVYTGISHDVGSIIAPEEIAHQILYEMDDVSKSCDFEDNAKVAYDYVWQSYVTGGQYEGARVGSLIPGLGMAANSFLPMINTRSLMGKVDSAGVNVDESGAVEMGPGSGAFSAYHGTIYLAEVPLEAGSEVFVDYGDGYFRGRPSHFGMVPLIPEFEAANNMLAPFYEALKSSQNLNNLFTEGDDVIQAELQNLWQVTKHAFVTDERVRNALPYSIVDIPRAAIHGTPYNYLRGDNPRSVDWLQSNGYCMDTLSIRKSSIPHAGRGTFAKSSFQADETILPLPLVQMKRNAVHIIQKEEVHSHQLILNYCFGHKDSSLLLYPYSSSSNFINHGGKDANAKLIWAENDLTGFHKKYWLSISTDTIIEQKQTGLLMLLVATRDIAEDEEVTIDYGHDWQEAWSNHVRTWSSHNMQVSASELNESEKQIRTIFEEPYPMMTSCHYRYQASGQDAADSNSYNEATRGSDKDDGEEAFRRKLEWIEAHATTWQDLGGRNTMSGDHLRPCSILVRQPDPNGEQNDTYIVQMFDVKREVRESDKLPRGEHYVKGVPRRAILFLDSSSTSNQQNVRAFRHEIGIPDDIWPNSWRDLQ